MELKEHYEVYCKILSNVIKKAKWYILIKKIQNHIINVNHLGHH